MEQITLGQIEIAVGFLVALIAGVKTIKTSIKDWLKSALKEQFDGVNKRFDELDTKQTAVIKRLDTVDIENCKNYLVTFLAEVARGGTGAASFTANCVVMSGSSTTAALTTRAVTNNTSATALAANTNYTTLMARGMSLHNADTNPSVNGAICWTYS